MNYHLNRDGQNLGTFPLEELRQRREAGELTGHEYVWCSGMANWQRLDAVLYPQSAAPTVPPSVAAAPRKSNKVVIALVVAGLLVFIGGVIAVAVSAKKFMDDVRKVAEEAVQNANVSATVEVQAADTPPIKAGTNTLTQAKANDIAWAFRTRQYLSGYRENGDHTKGHDAEVYQMIETWINESYGRSTGNLPAARTLGDKLAADPTCTDPVALLVAGITCAELGEAIKRLERSVAAFEKSSYPAYPRFYATVTLATKVSNDSGRVRSLDAAAVQLFKRALKDGSLQPGDQPLIADIFLVHWGENFFQRNATVLCEWDQQSVRDFEWLHNVMRGERAIKEAWRARGTGYANTVSEKGWEIYSRQLGIAREHLTKAWELHPEWPQAPARMISVAMGDEGAEEMRVWFDRALAAQIDHVQAWHYMSYGLLPRWHGDLPTLLGLAISAVDTGRYDTDVPRKFFDILGSIENELDLAPGEHIYGRADIWPHVERVYEGYLKASEGHANHVGWRSTYAVVAYIAGKYEVAKAQFEAVDWKPWTNNFDGWSRDFSLLPLEVAARTSPAAFQITGAEETRDQGRAKQALESYRKLAARSDLDDRTQQFIRHRLAALELEAKLQTGEWVDFLPNSENDLNWIAVRGKHRVLPDGALEVESGATGHMLFSRVRTGPAVEVRGQFELVRSSDKAFQGGLVLGMPSMDTQNWHTFRIKRNQRDGEIVSFARQWSRRQVYEPIVVNDITNSFTMLFRDGSVTASVNDLPALIAVKPPDAITITPNEFYVGVGAFNDMNETVIRYRNLQVRQLKASQVAQEE